jgi:hypothetical protein
MSAPRRRRTTTTTTVYFDPPMVGLVLELPERKIMGKVAREVARAWKRAVRQGKVPSTGAPLRRAEDRRARRPLRRTGALLRAVRGKASVSRSTGRVSAVVTAYGEYPGLQGRLRGRPAGLLGVLIHGRRSWPVRPRQPGLFALGQGLEGVAMRAFDRALAGELAAGRARIVRGRLPVGGLGARLGGGGAAA